MRASLLQLNSTHHPTYISVTLYSIKLHSNACPQVNRVCMHRVTLPAPRPATASGNVLRYTTPSRRAYWGVSTTSERHRSPIPPGLGEVQHPKQNTVKSAPVHRHSRPPPPALPFISEWVASELSRRASWPELRKRRSSGRKRNRKVRVLPYTSTQATKAQKSLQQQQQIDQVQRLLGLQHPGLKVGAAIFIALDTEREGNNVVEVGVTILDCSSLAHIEPGPGARDWIACAKHYRIVLDTARSSDTRLSNTSQFAVETSVLSPPKARDLLLRILHDFSQIKNTSLILVGHGIDGDLVALRDDPGLRLDLRQHGFETATVIDTFEIACHAQALGLLRLQRARLGNLVRNLGIEAKHWAKSSGVLGTHNASNDAAYSLIALLLFASKWHRLTTKPQSWTQRWIGKFTRRHRPLWFSWRSARLTAAWGRLIRILTSTLPISLRKMTGLKG